MDKRKLNIGIIGCGRMGKIRAEATACTQHNLIAAFDTNELKLVEFQTIFPSCMVFNEIDKIPWEIIDVIFICSPPGWHDIHLSLVIKKKKAFFIEKPLYTNSNGIAETAREAQQNRIINAVGYMNRYRPSIQYIKDLQVIGLTSFWINKMYQVPWWTNLSESGGPINEQATHLLDLNRYILGEVEDVFANCSPNNYKFPTTVSISLKFQSGQLGNILYSCDSNTKNIGLTVFTKEEQINLIGWDFNITKQGYPAFTDLSAQQIFNIETEAFFYGVIENSNSFIRSDIQDAYKTQILVDAVNYSLKTNSVVSMKEFEARHLHKN